MKIDKNKLKYANEHPKGKKPTEDNNIKLASSKPATARKRALESAFDNSVLMWESSNNAIMPLDMQDDLYKSLRKKMLGR